MATVPYHHGDLRRALVDAATDLAREGGPAAVLLREAARRVGVSHNAGYRHFANRDDLLQAVTERGLTALARAMEAALDEMGPTGDGQEGAWSHLEAIGRAYVRFALAEPGLFRTAFAVAGHPGAPSPSWSRGSRGLGPYEMLQRCIDDLVRTGAVPADRRANSEVAAWAGVHGLAALLLDGPLRVLGPDSAEAALERVCRVVREGL